MKKQNLEAKEGENYAVYLVDIINNTVIKKTDTNKIENILSLQEFFSSDSDSLNLFVVGEYRNILALYGNDSKLGGFHEKESFSLIDKDTHRQLLHIESSLEVPSIRYHIDSENGYCYILHDKHIKKCDMLTGNVIWECESNDLDSFTIVDDAIYLTKNNYAVIIDSSTGKEISKADIVGYEEAVYSSSKAQKLFVIEDKLNSAVRLLDKYGKVVKELSGSIYYNDSEFIILEGKSQDSKSQRFKYISLENPDKEIDIVLNSKESLQVLNNDYLIVTQNNSIKIISVDDRKYIWEKEIDDFRAAKIYKDNIYISGKYFICAAVKDGKEKWRDDNYFNAPLDYMFSLGNKLFISHNGTDTDINYYRVYNIETGEFLYHISDFYAVLSNIKNVFPFYQSSDKTYLSKYGGGICVINE